MPELLVIVPSRGRPQNIARLIAAWADTASPDRGTDLLVAVDDDDPAKLDYLAATSEAPFAWLEAAPGPRVPGMTNVLNHYARAYAGSYQYLGFCGDDHLPITPGWDARIRYVLGLWPAGICYGDDQLQRANLPTAVFLTANIVRRLGWMAPPMLRHLYVDNAWKDLGLAAGVLTYLPEVVIQHVHPVAQRAAWDEGYARVNHPDLDTQDREAYLAWRHGPAFTEAVWAVQQLNQPEGPGVAGG
jgi:hypothetical protein